MLGARSYLNAIIGGIAHVIALLALTPASAQNYPTQDVRLICGYPAGRGADIIVR